MARSMGQFQRGLSVVACLTKCGSEAVCSEALFKLRWPGGFECPECGNSTYCEIKARRVFQCDRRYHQTARTIFDQAKLLLTTWFLAILLLTQSKTGLSGLALARHLGVSYNTT